MHAPVSRFVHALFAAALLLSLSAQAQTKLPNVTILATGGTIAGTGSTSTTTVGYTAATVGVQTLIRAVPELAKVANVTGEQVFQIASENMGNGEWLTLAKRINVLLGAAGRGWHRHHARHRHDGRNRLLPEPGRQEPQAGGAGGRDASLHRPVGRRSDQPVQRGDPGRHAGSSRQRRDGCHERPDPRRARREQDEYFDAGRLQNDGAGHAGLLPGQPCILLPPAGAQAHGRHGVRRERPDGAAAGRYRLRLRERGDRWLSMRWWRPATRASCMLASATGRWPRRWCRR